MRRNTLAGVLAGLVLAVASMPAHAQLGAQAFISKQQVSPGNFEYSVTLFDTGTTPISTLWFGWIPNYDMLSTAPTHISSPAGWSGINAPDLFGTASVQWVASSPMQPGDFVSGFVFDSPDPNVTTATSFFGLPMDISYVYIGAPLTDAGSAVNPAVVPAPEPASLAFVLLPAVLLIRRKRA